MSTGPSNVSQMLADLTVAVARATTVTDSAVAFIEGVPALLQAAIDEGRAQGATEEQLAAFTTLHSELQSEIGDLENALLANTPQQLP